MASNTIEIDGSVLEGGGQILRMSVTLSVLCGVPIRICKIRAARSKPGLAAQHLKGILLVKDMCGARVRGAEIGSTEVEFIPSQLKGGEYFADTCTAGSISLLLQIALPCAIFANAPVILQLKGGTNAELAPQVDFTTEVFRRNMEKFGATFDFELHRRGYFPKGGGHVTASILPIRSLTPVNMTDAGVPKCLNGWSFVAGTLPIQLAYHMEDGAKRILKNQLGGCQPNIESYKESSEMAPHNANGIILVCETTGGCFIGGSGLAKRELDPYSVGSLAAEQIVDTLSRKACVDSFTQDQLIIFMALAEGLSSIRVGEVTMHTKTAIFIAETLTKAKFTIEEDGNSNIISCVGIGLQNKNNV